MSKKITAKFSVSNFPAKTLEGEYNCYVGDYATTPQIEVSIKRYLANKYQVQEKVIKILTIQENDFTQY